MYNSDVRWKQRFEHYESALSTIETIAPGYLQFSELEKDGLVQRFEYTFDLAWKVMQDYVLYGGYAAVKGPRASIMQMAHDDVIDAFIWGDMLTARNELSHVYDEDKSRSYIDSIINEYLPAFKSFKIAMQQKL